MVGIRVAKYGRQLMENYRTLVDELAQEDLDLLAHARSCSVSSIATPPNQTQYNTTNDNARQFTENSRHVVNEGRLSRASSSSSSGCMSDGAPSSCEVIISLQKKKNIQYKRTTNTNVLKFIIHRSLSNAESFRQVR